MWSRLISRVTVHEATNIEFYKNKHETSNWMLSVFLSWRTPLQTWNMSFCRAIRWQNCPNHHWIVYIQHFPFLKPAIFYRQSKPICSMKYLPTFGPLWATIGVYDICWEKNPAAWSNMGRLSQRSPPPSFAVAFVPPHRLSDVAPTFA
jgi:hypothetical protein